MPVRNVVLGDSLSDGQRVLDPAGLGSAWPAAAARRAREAGTPLAFENRAVGGARSVEVLADLRNSRPDLSGTAVTLLVGANDVWRRHVPWLDHEPVDPDDFLRNLRRILSLARELGAVSLAVGTPALIAADPDHLWNGELREYRELCREAASREGALAVPMGEDFEAAVRAFPAVKWTYDGVHPRPVGHERIAATWLHHVAGFPPLPVDRLPDRPSDFRLSTWP